MRRGTCLCFGANMAENLGAKEIDVVVCDKMIVGYEEVLNGRT